MPQVTNLDTKLNTISRETDLELLKNLPSKSVDLILTDPPYVISKSSGMDEYKRHLDAGGKHSFHPDGSENRLAFHTDYGEWDSKFTLDHLQLAVDEMYRVLRPGGSCIIWFDVWKLETLRKILDKFSKHRIIEWMKTNPVPINQSATYLSNCREAGISCVKGGKATFNSKYDKGIYEYPIYQSKDRFHPTQKSLDLFEELIRKHSNEGDVVVDPYGGSGTTAVAAKLNKRDFYTCERDETYFVKAKKRIEEINTLF